MLLSIVFLAESKNNDLNEKIATMINLFLDEEYLFFSKADIWVNIKLDKYFFHSRENNKKNLKHVLSSKKCWNNFKNFQG